MEIKVRLKLGTKRKMQIDEGRARDCGVDGTRYLPGAYGPGRVLTYQQPLIEGERKGKKRSILISRTLSEE
jgi:hypothetical protein